MAYPLICAEWAMKAKAEQWPLCQDCREPITRTDQKNEWGKAGFCHYCWDGRMQSRNRLYWDERAERVRRHTEE